MTRDDICTANSPTAILDLDGSPTGLSALANTELKITYLFDGGLTIRALGGTWTYGQLFEVGSAMRTARQEGYRECLSIVDAQRKLQEGP